MPFPAALAAALIALSAAAAWAADDVLPDYVGSAACADCHAEAAADWAKSHHGLAWTPRRIGRSRTTGSPGPNRAPGR